MNPTLFQRIYGAQYQKLPRSVYVIPLVLTLIFLVVLAVLGFTHTDKVIYATGVVLPEQRHELRTEQRGFLLEQHLRLGQTVARGQLLVRMQLDNGVIKDLLAPGNGVVVDSDLLNTLEGSLPEGALIASLVDPVQLQLKIEVPAAIRGNVLLGTPVRYTFDTFLRSVTSRVSRRDIRMLSGNEVSYTVYAQLKPEHQKIAYLGKSLPVKLLVQDVSLFDYFLIN